MKTCIACGMPMEKESDYAMNDQEKNYCVHCARADGTMQSFEEKRDNLSAFIMKTQGFDKEAAYVTAEKMMAKLPAWKDFFMKDK